MALSHSKIIAVVGGQWGDEGKGKITDFFFLKSRLCNPLSGWKQCWAYCYC